MGAINYGSSDYINIGLKAGDYEDEYVADMYDIIHEIVDHYNFTYFNVKIKSGYYEGFYINIRADYPEYFYDCGERLDAQKEVTKLKKMLLECVKNGLVEYSPGWCTGYNDINGTKLAVMRATQELRREVNNIPTMRQAIRAITRYSKI